PNTEDNTTNNLWKTAFVVLVGIVGLSAAMIYFTQSKQTNPTTQLQTDINGQPVQPLNPATGMNEQGASSLMPYSSEMMANSNAAGMPIPQTMPGGDGYDPWARGGQPPPGAPPIYVQPGGQVITIPGESGSQFMPPDGSTGYILVPANTNANVNVKPSPTPKGKATPTANTQTSPTPAENPQSTPETKPTPAPKTEKTPAKPAEKPKPTPPASSGKQTQSGKEQDS
ncbi:MAG: hypothetical protein H0V31_07370, partial [Acidobacteria bacterium]|nr:hypothetical protein [Acidobacteriota bacterium]